MIYIDLTELKVPDEWKERAKRATEELLSLPESKRAGFIDTHENIWRDLKSELKEVSFQKCWYCEGKTDRFDFHVDHYRPKKLVKNKGCSEEIGYWWLAFDHCNFRLACDYCDSLHTEPDKTHGKGNQFPLAPGSPKASSPSSNIEDEVPLLLDPTRSADPLLLWFQDDGSACPLWRVGLPYERARETIDILNLNRIETVERRKALLNKCFRYVERANRIFAFYQNDPRAAYQEFQHLVEEILGLVSPSAEYSSAVRAFLGGLTYEWVKGLLR